MTPGEYLIDDGEIELNVGRERVILTVANTGDRPVQVGSHYHFYETNLALEFAREGDVGAEAKPRRGRRAQLAPRPGGDRPRPELMGTDGLRLRGDRGRRGRAARGVAAAGAQRELALGARARAE